MTVTPIADLKGPTGATGPQGEQGLPGTNAVTNDAQTAAFLSSTGSETYAAARAGFLAKADMQNLPDLNQTRNNVFTKLPNWRRQLQLAQYKQSPARVLCVGDSTTAGVHSDSYSPSTAGTSNQGGPNSWPARLAAWLTARGVPALYAMGVPGRTNNDDSRWDKGTANYSAAAVGAGGAANLAMVGAGKYCAFTPGYAVNVAIVYYFGDPGTGEFTAQMTGGSAVAVSTVQVTPGIYKSAVIIGGAASASNTVTITNTSGTCFIVGVEYYDQANPNTVRILNAGVGQSTANVWANDADANKFGGRAFIKGVAPILTIMSLGINDAAGGRTAGQVMADVSTLAGDAALSGDVLLASPFPHPNATSLDPIIAAYQASTRPLVDWAWRYGNSMQAGGMQPDGTHPNALGYNDAAMLVADALIS